jgi:hypothetical protein
LDISKNGLTNNKNKKRLLKKILNLENPIDNEIEKDKNEYVIINDNLKKWFKFYI